MLKADFIHVNGILQDIFDFRKNIPMFVCLYEKNVRKWICRISLSGTQKLLILPDINKNEIRMPISDISDLKNFSEQIIEVVQRYLHPVLLKEVLYTRWGNYEMPEPYKILLEKGPRKNLKKLQ